MSMATLCLVAKVTQMSINKWIVKQTVVYLLLSWFLCPAREEFGQETKPSESNSKVY
jgi:hypothetical protein